MGQTDRFSFPVGHPPHPPCTVLVLRMAHRKWKEFKQQPSMLLGSAVPGGCLVSFYFLLAILSTTTVDSSTTDF